MHAQQAHPPRPAQLTCVRVLAESNKKLIAEYLSSHGFFSYNALSLDDDPTKSWIGREVKKFLAESHVHLPFLLCVASAPIDVLEGDPAEKDGSGIAYAADDPYAPSPEDLAAEAALEPLMVQSAEYWDNFLEWVRDIQTTWTSDTDEYRETRAVSWFNHSRQCGRDIHALKPTMKSWVPHVACYVVTRQIVAMGDPGRRSADSCESFGAVEQ